VRWNAPHQHRARWNESDLCPSRQPVAFEAMSAVRAIRGATSVDEDNQEEIRSAMCELWSEIVARNEIHDDDLISVIVAVTDDLHSMFAGQALREECGLDDVPLLGTVDAAVVGGMTKTLRVMAHVNTDKTRGEIAHVYLRNAANLRPDLSSEV